MASLDLLDEMTDDAPIPLPNSFIVRRKKSGMYTYMRQSWGQTPLETDRFWTFGFDEVKDWLKNGLPKFEYPFDTIHQNLMIFDEDYSLMHPEIMLNLPNGTLFEVAIVKDEQLDPQYQLSRDRYRNLENVEREHHMANRNEELELLAQHNM